MKYNPAFLCEDELQASFVVRALDLDLLLEVISENTGSANRHVLVVGQRGMGKTTLALRTVMAVRHDPILSKILYPLVFSEESYEVASPGELWLKALFHLADQTGEERWRTIHEALREERDETRLRERALARLMDFAEERSVRLLLVVENLNMLFEQQLTNEDAWVLRHTLQNEPRLMVLSTATSRFDQLEQSDKALFELFKVHELLALDTDACRTLWQRLTGQMLKDEGIRPVEILTGGNPRLIAILADFARDRSFACLLQELCQLIDENTTYFKANLESLPPLERKVFVALADIWEPAEARRVGALARMDVNKASALLQRLTGRGVVQRLDHPGRRAFYQVSERLYNIYHVMRQRGTPEHRVKALVKFIKSFYLPSQLPEIARDILKEACGLESTQRMEHMLAVKEMYISLALPEDQNKPYAVVSEWVPSLGADASWLLGELGKIPVQPVPRNHRADSVKIGPADRISSASQKKRNQTAVQKLLKAALKLSKENRVDEALDLAKRATHRLPESIQAWRVLARLYAGRGDSSQSLSSIDRALALEPANPQSHQFKVLCLHMLKMENAREKALQDLLALQLPPDIALDAANLFYKTNFHDGAEELLQNILKTHADMAVAWTLLGMTQLAKKNLGGAESSLLKAVELDSGLADGWGYLGNVYRAMGLFEKAMEAYQRLCELMPDSARPLRVLASVLTHDLEDHRRAEGIYKKITEIEPDQAQSWSDLAWTMFVGDMSSPKQRDESRLREALAAAEQAVKIDPNHIHPWFILAQIRAVIPGLEISAEDAFKKALELEPGAANALALLGQLYLRVGRREDAHSVLVQAAGHDPGCLPAWDLLLKWARAESDQAAALCTVAEMAEDLGVKDPVILNNIAWALQEPASPSLLVMAERIARSAMALAPADGHILHTLAMLLGRGGQWPEALLAIRPALDDQKLLESPEEVIGFFVEAAAAGQGPGALEVLAGTRAERALEPLVVAMKLELSQPSLPPQEVAEVARDVRNRIRRRRLELQSSGNTLDRGQ